MLIAAGLESARPLRLVNSPSAPGPEKLQAPSLGDRCLARLGRAEDLSENSAGLALRPHWLALPLGGW